MDQEFQTKWKQRRVPGNVLVSRRYQYLPATDKAEAMLVEHVILETVPPINQKAP